MDKKNYCPLGISRTCEKILAVLLRKEIDLNSHFHDVDSKHRGLISDSEFFVIVYNRLGHEFGLCQEEVRELGDYLKKENGEVSYIEFLELVLPRDKVQEAFVTGLEWEDHSHVNVLSTFDARKLNLIMTKITYVCQQRNVFLEPYFKEYDRQSGNNGTVTVAHFRRILNFAGITLGAKEFQLVINRFMKYGYTVNYVAFMKEIQEILQWFDEKGFLDDDKRFLEDFPGKIICAEVDSLPRPEVGAIDMAKTFGTEQSSHPCVHQNEKRRMEFDELLRRIKKHVLDNSIRTREFLEKFDKFKRGFITKSQFHRGLDCIFWWHQLHVAPQDLEKIFMKYQDQNDPERVNWSKFCDDVDEVFTYKNLDKHPYKVVESPPEEIKQLSRPGSVDWDHMTKPEKDLAQETLFRVRNIIKDRKIYLESFFKSFDKTNRFHVSRSQMRRVLSSHSILISETEVTALMNRYGDDIGFNYWKFLEDINEVQFCEVKHEEILTLLKKVNEKTSTPCSKQNFSIIDVIAKVKGQITRNRINIDQFMKNEEVVNKEKISETKFRSSFGTAGIKLNDCELDILCKAFRHRQDSSFVDHKSFCEMMNQAFVRTKLEKKPLTQPVQYIPSPDDSLNFLNFEERCVVSKALQKLSRHNDDVSNMKSFFDDRCRDHGTIDKLKFEQVMTICGGLNELLTKNEFDVVFKCFSKPSGIGFKFDYKNFLFVLSSLN